MCLRLIEGLTRMLKGNAEKDLECEMALEGFSERCMPFICMEVCCIPLKASSLHTILKMAVHSKTRCRLLVRAGVLC